MRTRYSLLAAAVFTVLAALSHAQINSNETTDGLVIRTQGLERMRITSSGVVGVAWPTVAGSGAQFGVSATGTAGAVGGLYGDGTTSAGVYGYSTSSYGVVGRSRNSSFGGVIGYHYSDNTRGYGILGHPSWGAYGVGRQVNSTGGVYGLAGGGAVYGALGYRDGTAVEYSVYGGGPMYIGSSNNAVPAIYGYHSGSHYGVRGYSVSSYGGYFQSANSYGLQAEANGGSAGQVALYAVTGASSNHAFLGHNTAWNVYCYIGYSTGYSIVCSGPTSGVSDERLKKDFTPLKQSEGLAAIMRLHPTYYRWKDPKMNGNHKYPEMGFKAQEVEKVLPALVGEVDQPSGTTGLSKLPGGKQKVLNYERLIVPAILAIQQLKKEQDDLKAQLSRLEAEAR